MKNKKNIFILIVVILLLIILLFFNIITNKKIDEDGILNNTFISFGNSSSYCEIKETKMKENKIIKKYKKYDYVKLDKIINIEEISYDRLKYIIYETTDNEFKYGFSLLDDKIVLLAEEINSNNLINYNNYAVDFDKLNEYLKNKGINEVILELDNIKIFTTESKYLENNKFINLNMKNGYNRRDLDKNSLNDTIDNIANTLESMNQTNGKYIYGFRTNTGKELTSYNILRHAGSTWSLIVYYEKNPNEKLKQVIENSIDYLLDNYLIEYSDDIYFIIEKKTNEIKLGGNALTLLMLSEYNRVFNDNKYDNYAEKIANGIIFMQQDDGSYYHVLNVDGTLKEVYRTVYYDGEATFSLLKYYQVSNDLKYLEYAKKTIDMFLENDYEQYRDHWIEYAMLEFMKYDMSEKYIEFALDNYLKNRTIINSKTSFGPTRLELLLSTYKLYNYVLNNNPDSEVIKNFDVSLLEESIKINLDVLFEYYVGAEVAMYSSNPSKVIYGFHAVNDNFRMRIDDIQHSLVALIVYYDEFVN